MPIRDILLPEFDQEMANTRRMLERVPDDRFDFQPHEKSWKLERLTGHVVDLPSWVGEIVRVQLLEMEPGDFKPFEPTSRKELLDRFDKNVSAAHAALAGATDAQLSAEWTMKWGGKTVMSLPRYNVLRGVVMNHLIHHRAQLGMYLRLMNVAVPGMYGPSADEPQFAPGEKAA
jgi:uncharacterized damage-inducible protein DinB